MSAQVCTPSSLAAAGSGLPLSDKEFRGVLIYLLAKWLPRLGGTDFTGDYSLLNAAAATFPTLDPVQQWASILEIIRSVASDDGATIPTTASDLVAAAITPINSEYQKEVILFLICSIGRRM